MIVKRSFKCWTCVTVTRVSIVNLLFIMKDGNAFKNLLVDPTDESYRGSLKPRGYNWMGNNSKDSDKHWH